MPTPSSSFPFALPVTFALIIVIGSIVRWNTLTTPPASSSTSSVASYPSSCPRPTLCPACYCSSPVPTEEDEEEEDVRKEDDDNDETDTSSFSCPPVTCPSLSFPPPSDPTSNVVNVSFPSSTQRTPAAEALLRQFIRDSTTQCKRTYFDVYPEWIIARDVLPDECPNILASIEGTTRERRAVGSGGFDLRGYPNRNPENARTFSPFPVFHPPCKLRWYTPHEACDLIASNNHVILSGDSLVRHIVTALYTLLTNNYRNGAVINANNVDVDWAECTCDGQYGGHSGCHRAPTMIPEFPEMVWESNWKQTVCGKWQTNRLHFLPAFGSLFDDDAVERILSHAAVNGGTTWYHSNGIGYIPPSHLPDNRIDTEAAFRLSWNKTITYATRYNNTRLIFGTVLAHEGTYPCQKREALDIYNAWIKDIAQQHKDLGIEVFDGRKIMQETASYDLVHFLSHDNIFLAQVFLNVLAKGPQYPRTRPAVLNLPFKGKHFRDFPLQYPYDQNGIPPHEPPYTKEPETTWYLGPQYDLRGCRCYKDWERRLNSNTSLCHCHGWCTARVNPVFLTENFPLRKNKLTDFHYSCKNGNEGWYEFMCQETSSDGTDLNNPLPCGYPYKQRTVSKGLAGITDSMWTEDGREGP